MIQGNTNTGKIYQLEASCTTQPFKDLYSDMTFLSMMTSIVAITEYIWHYSFMPSHLLLADGTIRPHFPTFDQRFYSFTFGICSGTTCVHDDSVFWSDGSILTDPNWKGPVSSYPKNRMIIFNASIYVDLWERVMLLIYTIVYRLPWPETRNSEALPTIQQQDWTLAVLFSILCQWTRCCFRITRRVRLFSSVQARAFLVALSYLSGVSWGFQVNM